MTVVKCDRSHKCCMSYLSIVEAQIPKISTMATAAPVAPILLNTTVTDI